MPGQDAGTRIVVVAAKVDQDIETEVGDVSVPGQHFSAEPFLKVRKAS